MTIVLIGLRELLVLGTPDGIWTGLFGWFLLTAANAESADVRSHAILEGLTACALLHTEPLRAAPEQDVEHVIPVAAGSGRRVFPVCDDTGRPVSSTSPPWPAYP